MLIHLYGEEFPARTFIILVDLSQCTVAHLRSSVLHILNEINRVDLQFRFKLGGVYWKDASLISDYVRDSPVS